MKENHGKKELPCLCSQIFQVVAHYETTCLRVDILPKTAFNLSLERLYFRISTPLFFKPLSPNVSGKPDSIFL